jgi:hypothetical protein
LRLPLVPHPASAVHARGLCAGVELQRRVSAAELEAGGGGVLALVYRFEGEVERVRLPLAAASPERHDGLWRHSCAELFVAEPDARDYREFNFAPSGHWAAYAFTDYRAGMHPHAWAVGAPQIALHHEPGALELRVQLPWEALPQAPRLRLGLTAVLEMLDGSFGFWALRHPQERPDFHHRDGFAVEFEGSA